jgi:hypothetical protein
MKEFVKGLSDKASNYLDTKGLANPVEVINEELGGETREESKVRRAKAKEPAKAPTEELTAGTIDEKSFSTTATPGLS